MALTQVGALKIAAGKAGMTYQDYVRRTAEGEHWCTFHRQFHPVQAFGKDGSRASGLETKCKTARAEIHKVTYHPAVPLQLQQGPQWRVPARNGDRRQARRRINYLVEQGVLPHPNTLACTDCGHEWVKGERRHEYDHFEGYDASSQLAVQAVCTRCHHTRERLRNER